MPLKLKQIVAAQWRGKNQELTYTLFGLANDGTVYRNGSNGWKPENMTVDENLKSKPRSLKLTNMQILDRLKYGQIEAGPENV